MTREEWNKAFAERMMEVGFDLEFAKECADAADDAFADGEDPRDSADCELSYMAEG